MSKWMIFLAVLGFASLTNAQTDEWKQLFDGKDLTGWKHVGPGSMTVEDGLIQTHGGMGLLYWTGGKLGDCVIRVVYRMVLFEREAVPMTEASNIAMPSTGPPILCEASTM